MKKEKHIYLLYTCNTWEDTVTEDMQGIFTTTGNCIKAIKDMYSDIPPESFTELESTGVCEWGLWRIEIKPYKLNELLILV